MSELPTRVVCARCRGLNQSAATVCAHCHEPLAPEVLKDDRPKATMTNPGQRRCPGCGKWSSAPAVYCPDCGVKLPRRGVLLDDGEAAAFVPRLIAFAIDCLVLCLIRQWLLGRLHHRPFEWEDFTEWRQYFPSLKNPDLTDILSYFVFDAAYFTLLVGAWGRTLGKWLLGLKITREGGTPVGYGLAFMRYLAHYFSLIPLGAGYLFIAFSHNHRGFHDLLCQTRVIHLGAGANVPITKSAKADTKDANAQGANNSLATADQ